MAFQKSEYKEEYEPTPNELAYEFDRPIHRKLYLYDDEVNEKLTEVFEMLKSSFMILIITFYV